MERAPHRRADRDPGVAVSRIGGSSLALHRFAARSARSGSDGAGGAARDVTNALVASTAAQLSGLAIEVGAAVSTGDVRVERAVFRARLDHHGLGGGVR